MTFAAIGSFIEANVNTASSMTVSLNNQGAGDLLMLETTANSVSVWATSVSGGGATWSQMGTRFTGVTNPFNVVVFAGTVTATGAQTATVTYNGTANLRGAGQEFTSTVGSWALDVQGHIDSSGTNTWASLTPAAAGELYFGYATNSVGAVAGSTPGYTYKITALGNGCAFNPACTSAAQAPVWGDSTQQIGVMVLVREVSIVRGGQVPAPDDAPHLKKLLYFS